MTVDEAIEIVARRAAWLAVEAQIGDDWENYPEIEASDWQRVVEVGLGLLLPMAGESRFDEAYALLAAHGGGS